MVDESTDGGMTQAQFSGCPFTQNGRLMFAYKTKTASPYSIKITSLNINIPPIADFSAAPTSGTVALNVTFTDQSTNTPTSWSWDFGDGNTSTSQNPYHVYEWAGYYTVTLNASNAGGYDLKIKVDYIHVTAPPIANFYANVTSGYTNLSVQFTDTSTRDPTSWYWEFGDGGTSTQQNPVHVYIVGGSFNVTLYAANSDGNNSLTRTQYINVTLTLAFITTSPLDINISELYEYRPQLNYAGVTLTILTNSTQVMAFENGTAVGDTPSAVSLIWVSITAVGPDGQVAYQNYTLNVQYAEGHMTDEAIMLIVIALVMLGLLTFLAIKAPKFMVLAGFGWIAVSLWQIQPFSNVLGLIGLCVGLFFSLWGGVQAFYSMS